MPQLKCLLLVGGALTISAAAYAQQTATPPSDQENMAAEEAMDADALIAAERWAEAAEAYEALLRADASDADNWFNLGRARQHQEQNKEAAEAYRRSIATGYQPLPRAQLYLARVYMLDNQPDEALTVLEQVAEGGAVSFRTVQGIAEFAPLAENPRYVAVIADLTPCTAPEYRHFDFWLGEWDVTSAGSSSASASNTISREHGGCVLLEQYTAGAFTGMSLNFYDSTTGKWHQTWMSNSGGALYIEGGLNDQGQMVLTDAGSPSSAATNATNRITWTPNPDGSVRQFWQTSSDGGETWNVAFDGLYTPKTAAE